MQVKLTITIPTYNRAAELQAQLDRLIPQLTPQVRCCVYDNASTDETRQVMEKCVAEGISYFRSSYNGGAGRNMLRCLEECQTEWLWILGDDDAITPHAVVDLLSVIQNCECEFIHTSSSLCRYDSDIVISNVPELFKRSNIASLLWISCGIYKMSVFRPLLKAFALSISTCGPQAALVLSMLEAQNGKILLSSASLITEIPAIPRWSSLDVIVRFCQLPEYLLQPSSQQAVADAIFLEIYQITMLLGLREINQPNQIRRWQRIQKIVPRVLKSHRASAPWTYALKNWFRSGKRKKSLTIIYTTYALLLLGWCPVALFQSILKILPLPEIAVRSLKDRQKYTVSD